MLYNTYILYVRDMAAEPTPPTHTAELEVDVVDLKARLPGINLEVSISQARSHLPELLDDVRNGGVVYLTRYGKRLAALVPVDAAEYLDRLEDRYWSDRAKAALSEDPVFVPLAEAIADWERERQDP